MYSGAGRCTQVQVGVLRCTQPATNRAVDRDDASYSDQRARSKLDSLSIQKQRTTERSSGSCSTSYVRMDE